MRGGRSDVAAPGSQLAGRRGGGLPGRHGSAGTVRPARVRPDRAGLLLLPAPPTRGRRWSTTAARTAASGTAWCRPASATRPPSDGARKGPFDPDQPDRPVLAALVDELSRARRRGDAPGSIPEPGHQEACLYTMTPDGDFILDAIDGVVVCGGDSGHALRSSARCWAASAPTSPRGAAVAARARPLLRLALRRGGGSGPRCATPPPSPTPSASGELSADRADPPSICGRPLADPLGAVWLVTEQRALARGPGGRRRRRPRRGSRARWPGCRWAGRT